MRRISRGRALRRVSSWVMSGVLVTMTTTAVGYAQNARSLDDSYVSSVVAPVVGSPQPIPATSPRRNAAVPSTAREVVPVANRSERPLLAQNGPVQTTAITDPGEGVKGSIVEKDVHTLLTDAGFKPIRERLVPIYRITVGSPNQQYPAAVVLTPDGSMLWVVVILGSWDRPEALPAEKLLALLEANSSVGPAYFAYNSRTKIVSLARAYENRGLEPKRLRSSIDTLALIAHDTKPLWDVTEVAKPKRDAEIRPAVQKTESPANSNPTLATPTRPVLIAKPEKHVGIWKCKLAEKTGFELSLTGDGKYTLRVETPFGSQLHVGRYSMVDNVLSLVADSGGKLEAAVEWQKSDTFSFRDRSKPDNAAIVFHRD